MPLNSFWNHAAAKPEAVAVVELQPACAPRPTDTAAASALAEAILAWLEPRKAKYKRPKSVDFVADLPRDPNGKLYKRKLRDPYWADRDGAI